MEWIISAVHHPPPFMPPTSDASHSPNTSSGVRESAAYGSACSGCSKAKCKCILRGQGLSCERCNRLGKQCSPSAVVRKRTTKRKLTTRRTAHLEEKLDDLVTLLKSQASDTQELPHRSAKSSCSASRHGNSPQHGAPDVDGTPPFRTQAQAPTPTQTLDTERQSSYGANQGHQPTEKESAPGQCRSSFFAEPTKGQAEHYLYTFRHQYLPIFPFVHIPPETT